MAFGYLQTKGYCHGKHCVTFPVVVGETGSFMSDQRDNQWLLDFADFVQAKVGDMKAPLTVSFAPLQSLLRHTAEIKLAAFTEFSCK